MNHSFNIELAEKYGIEEAILIENIAFWIKKNIANKKNFIDGNYWTYNSAKAFNELFPYMTPSKINRSLKKLVDGKILCSANYNKAKYDRTLWYSIIDKDILKMYNLAINPDNYSFCKMQNGKIKMQNGFVQNATPIPDINTDINTNINKSTYDVHHSTNSKGFKAKDKWEQFLINNLQGINYQPKVEKAIKNLLKKLTEEQTEKYLLEIYIDGLNKNLSIQEIVGVLLTEGRILIKKNTKVKKEQVEEIKVLTKKEKIQYVKEKLSEEELEAIYNSIKKEFKSLGVSEESSILSEMNEVLFRKYKKIAV